MTRRSRALATIESEGFVPVHPDDLLRLHVNSDDRVRVTSRRGSITLAARADRAVEPGTVFIPFHFRETAASVLT